MIENSLFCVVMKTELYELKRRVVVVALFYCKILYVYLYLSSCIQCYTFKVQYCLFIFKATMNSLFFHCEGVFFVLYKEYVVFLIYTSKKTCFLNFSSLIKSLENEKKLSKKCIFYFCIEIWELHIWIKKWKYFSTCWIFKEFLFYWFFPSSFLFLLFFNAVLTGW